MMDCGSRGNPWSDGARLDSLLAQLAFITSAQSAPSAVRQRLCVEARLQAVPPPPSRPRYMPATALAGALSAILLIGAIGEGASLLLSRPRVAAAVHTTLESLGIVKTPPANAAALPPAVDFEDEDPSTATSADVFALPYSDPAIANGTETTVRVSVPATQLMAWGVPSPARELDDDVAAICCWATMVCPGPYGSFLHPQHHHPPPDENNEENYP